MILPSARPLPSETTALPYLLVGLGNPGRVYARNRHNVGFMVIDALARQLNLGTPRLQMKALVLSGSLDGHKVILAKPQTYMNLSGEAVGSLVRYYKIPLAHLLVIHDDLDLPFGVIRLRPGGGAGGHKGLLSIMDRLGTQNFPRLRFGIGRPPGKMDPADYVLQDFGANEQPTLELLIDRAVQAIHVFVTEGLDAAMNRFNGMTLET
ncbi:aminoacyl-tRNA hydrolase [uncultured Thermanaerothrix sp.]|uniref:aminoacyl-tRNA hydrolase n=1 Tax=uncultured Thermanaerothrix sp. TaxID=1195149 RepID=UPI00261256EF|nr:aminoacyl-tRNA hydrolase [uncultured Thermanaerothrix sp.]